MRRRRRQLRAVLLLGAAGALVIVFTVPVSSSSPPARRSTTTITTGTVPAAAAVVISTVSLVDTSRTVVSGGVEVAPVRLLPTAIVRPARSGRFPLVVFAGGYDTTPIDYSLVLRAIAQAGYVVAAPSFPLEDPTRGNGLDRTDLVNEAGDLSFVISQLIAGPLRASIDSSHIVAMGHSDGADAALSAGYEQGFADSRLSAVIAVAPDPVTWSHLAVGPPLLIVHGSADEVVDPQTASEILDTLGAARWSLTLQGASHADAILGPSALTTSFDTAVLDFLGDSTSSGLGALTAELEGLPGTASESRAAA